MKVGAAFSDHIKTGRLRKRHYDFESPRTIRSIILIALLGFFPFVILLRLINIQLIYGSYYRALSDTNRTKTNILYPQRGIIFDRNGVPLVYNNPNFEKTNGNDTTQISREKAIEIMAQQQGGLHIESRRYYPFKESTAHVLGYVGKVSQQELALPAFASFTADDSIGKSGIESYYDSELRGEKGKELIEVDALGKKVRTLGETDPIPGKDITLTLDSHLQQIASDAFPLGEKGAVIASTPTGEILAMVSKPSFDPNLFTLGETYSATNSAYKTVTSILTDGENQPLMDRAISGTYPPGSTFKLVTAAAGLEQKIIDANYQVDDTGIVKLGQFSFGNWYYLEYGKKDGMVNVVKAIQRSNDIFFYKLAEKITVDKLSKTASEFGIGKQLGIDLPGEAKGILPTKEWKSHIMKEPWYLGDTYHYGIGQGYLLTTPLQVNNWTATIASGGEVYTPHLLKNSNTNYKKQKILSENTLNLLRQGMIEACSTGGVAYPLFGFRVKNSKLKIDGKNFLESKTSSTSAAIKDYRDVSIACKTGTAQHGDENTASHAWITLFAPAYNPQIVVTVLVESAGQGSDVAAPIAKKVLEGWFTEK